MDSWVHNEYAIPLTTAFTTIVVVVAFLFEEMHEPRVSRSQQPSLFRDLTRKRHMENILIGGQDYCVSYLRMDVGSFMHLSSIIRDRHLLVDSRHVSIEEQVAIFLYIVGHNTKNRTMRIEFLQSGETISRYFNNVLRAICTLSDDFVQPPSGICHLEIQANPNWYPHFKDCVGLLDGTHVDVSVPTLELPHFRGQKGPMQNVLAVVNPDLRFTYVLAGKYYLVDAGYTTMNGFIAPYQGV
ncbi:uncharacterized protein LOC120255181 [Dioscorea cayenensis subsp. rotundata]|uniref:Uncharacterized protein LOC120255181 n=1 Tax=Dioscorea cayennensis subsp. rotundata TaxID=55577 RepID=A0AB40AXF5_DIOCR|nr:uncharacterized protein LOC120255181 [Dioscorea cayenensis subsp. rotundata]